MSVFGLGALGLVGTTAVEVGTAVGEVVGGDLVAGAITGTIISETASALESATGYLVDKVFGDSTFENFEKNIKDSVSDIRKFGFLSDDPKSANEIVRMIREKKLSNTQIAEQVGNYASDLTNEILTAEVVPESGNSIIGSIISRMATFNPLYYYISSKLLDKAAELVKPLDEDYYKIESVYNGNGLYEPLVEFVNGEFFLFDEVGQRQSWFYPKDNNYPVVPPLWGTWTGINSPNNSVPMTTVVDGQLRNSWLDKCAFLHDIGYKNNGSFNKFSDYQLISRIVNNKDKLIIPGELEVANVAVSWFSTLGKTMRAIYGDNTSEGLIKDLYKEVYAVEITDDNVETLKTISKNTMPQIGTTSQTVNDNYLVNILSNLEITID